MVRIGQHFAEERQKKGLTTTDVAKATKIRESFIIAIENSEYQKLPSSAYAVGFVRNYAKFLGLPEEKSIALFKREFNSEKEYKVLPKSFGRGEEFSANKIKLSQGVSLVVIAILLVIGYLLFQYRYAFFSPPLDVTTPKEMTTTASSSVIVSGFTDANATVLINNDTVAVDADGNFRKTVALFSGKNTITIKVINHFGKVTMLQRHVMETGQ